MNTMEHDRIAHVTRLLEQFEPANDEEARHRKRMFDLLHDGERALTRGHFHPGHFTASGFVFHEAHGVALIHHRKLDKWLQPGGHIESDDRNVFAAALREIEEELGLHADDLQKENRLFDVDIHAIPALGSEPAHEHFDLRFRVVAKRPELNPSEEVTSARWFPINDVVDSAEDASIRRALTKFRDTL